MKSQFPLYLIVCGIGIIIGVLIKQPASDEQANTPVQTTPTNSSTNKSTGITPTKDLENLKSQINELQNSLYDEIEKREYLDAEFAQMKNTILADSITATENDSQPKSKTLRTRTRPNSSRDGQWFNAQALVDAGIDESQAQRIRDVYEDVQMQKLYLRDKAIREGWIGDERYRTERAELDKQLESTRNELGEKGYDAYLYAAGLPNRVIVTSALNNSPASKAGIQAGDNILKYDNKRIYSWSDLRTATSTGDIDAVIMVELIRNGQKMNVFIPRGPLGVQLDNTSVAPVN